MSSCVSVFCEIGAAPDARTDEIMTRSRRCVRLLSARALSWPVACARSAGDVRGGERREARSPERGARAPTGTDMTFV